MTTTPQPPATRKHPHLTPETEILLESGQRGRIAWVNRRRVYEYPARTAVLQTLRDALYRRRDGETPPAVVLTGPSKNGKTFTLEEMCHEHGRKFVSPAVNESRSPVIWPSDPVATFPTYVAEEIVDRFHGGPTLLKEGRKNAEDLAITFLGRYSPTELLVLDDLGEIPSRDITGYIDKIRREAGTGVVYTESTDTEEDSTETRRRFKKITGAIHVRLPAWKPGKRLEQLLRTIESETPLPEPSGLTKPDTMRRIAASGGETIGGILKIVRTAATCAIIDGRTSIRPKDIDSVLLRL